MSPALLSRTMHKWLALILGVQAVLWTVSGFYMVVVDLDFIHGDSLVRNVRVPLQLNEPTIGISQIVQQHPTVTQIALRTLPTRQGAVYEITSAGNKVLIDAVTGERLSRLTSVNIQELARSYYAGRGELMALTLLEHEKPLEIQTHSVPLWRATFSDWLNTTLYLHPDTGVLVTRRHRFWRWFDFLWMLHIMDYDTRDDVNNGLLRAATVLGTITVLSGVWLLYFSFRRPSRRPA